MAAGFRPEFEEPVIHGGIDPDTQKVLDTMLARHEPYPMLVMNRLYDVLCTNQAANTLLVRFVAAPAALAAPLNALHLLFDPNLARPFVRDWANSARTLCARLHRESLAAPHDRELQALVERIFGYPDVPAHWRQPDFSQPQSPAFTLGLARDGLFATFLTTVTVFSAPQNVTLQELRVESYYPADAETQAACECLA